MWTISFFAHKQLRTFDAFHVYQKTSEYSIKNPHRGIPDPSFDYSTTCLAAVGEEWAIR